MNSQADNHLLANYSTNQKISQGEEIFNYGDSAEKVYLILEGIIRLFIKDDNSQEQEIARLQSGDILGESALLYSQERSARAIAYKDTTLMAFTPDNFKKIMQEQAILNENIITNLCNRIQHLQQPDTKLPKLNPDNNQAKKNKTKPKQNKKNKSKNKIISELYLKGHQNYSKIAKEGFSHYLYTKSITCPICSKNIEVKKVRNSRLRLKDIRDDLRPIYKDFKPEWYKIWICPNCYYTARKNDFFDFSTRQEKKIKQKFKDRVKNLLSTNYQLAYSQPRTINEVFTAYYLAIKLYNLVDASKNKLAYSWLRLNWLYEDLGEEKLSKEASYKALNNLEEFYFKGDTTNLSRPQKDKLTLLLALLFYKHNFGKKALPLLDDLIRSYQTNPRQKRLARDKFIEIRRKIKKENQS